MHQSLLDSLGFHWTRAGVVTLLAVVVYLATSYCFYVYYDRELAFRDALLCSAKVFEEKNVNFWLLNGTLLGCRRLGRLILWDLDLDIGFLNSGDIINVSEVMASMDTRCFGGSSTSLLGIVNPISLFRKCTGRICAEFHETRINDSKALTGYGVSHLKELLPLRPCFVLGVAAMCPNNTTFYLDSAYGTEWLTQSLMKIF